MISLLRQMFYHDGDKGKRKSGGAMSDFQRIDHLYELAKAEGKNRIVLDDDLKEAILRLSPYANNLDYWYVHESEVEIGRWRGDLMVYWRPDALQQRPQTPEAAPKFEIETNDDVGIISR